MSTGKSKRSGWRARGVVVTLALMLSAASAVTAQAPVDSLGPDEPDEAGGARLTLESAYELARERNPRLRAARSEVDATAAREASAGLPPDPSLQLGVMNVSLPELDADMPASMAPSVQAVQRLPFPGKLGLSERIAEQSTAMAAAGAEEVWWEVRTRTARAWFAVYEADRKLVVMRETLGLLKDFHEVAQSMYGAGTGRQSDVLRATVEVSRMDAEIERMATARDVAVARLNAVLERAPGTAVGPTPFPRLPWAVPEAEELRGWAATNRPLLLRHRTAVERADTRRALAHREIWPDFSLGLQYGQRSDVSGVDRMGSAMVGFTVPVFAGSRQLRLREEAAALEAAAEAELAATRADVSAQIAMQLAELRRVRTLVDLYGEEILPQADANVESSFASYRVGAVDFMTLVDAQMAVNRYELEYHELLADYGRAVAELEAAVGRPLPTSTDTMPEAETR